MVDYEIVNNKTCIERTFPVKENLNKEEMRELNLKNNYEVFEEYEDMAELYVPSDETLFGQTTSVNWSDNSFDLIVWSRKKSTIEKEKKIKKDLENSGYKIYDIDIKSERIIVRGRIDFTKETLLKIESILKAKTFEVICDSFAGDCFVVYYING